MRTLAQHPEFRLDERTGWRAELHAIERSRGALVLAYADRGIALNDAAGTLGGLVPPLGEALDRDGTQYRLTPGTGPLERSGTCDAKPCRLPCFGGAGDEPRRLRDAHGIAISPRGDLFVADTGNGRVQVLALKGLALRAIWHALADGWRPWDVAVGIGGRVYVADALGNAVVVLDRHGCVVETLKDAGGRRLKRPIRVVTDAAGRLYVVQAGEADVVVYAVDGTFLERVRLRREVADRFCATPVSEPLEGEGTLLVGPLDSELHRCEWHRVIMGGHLAAGTALRVDTFTTELDRTVQQVRAMPASRWVTGPVHGSPSDADWDFLVLCPPGRYLWLRVTLSGDGSATPALRSLRVQYPRESSIRFLPAPYREEPAGADFTARFLSIFDTLRDGIGDRIAGIAALFDAGAAPAARESGDPDFLGWLGSWLGLSVERHWPESVRRRLVRNAHRLYRLRGTPEGLRLHVMLYLGVEPRLLEHFKLRRWLFAGEGRLGDASALFGAAVVKRLQLDEYASVGDFQLIDSGDPIRDPMHHYAHRFTVFVPAVREVTDTERRTLEQIVEMAKPAHTVAEVTFGAPGLRVGTHSFVGVDTLLAPLPSGVRLGDDRLGRGSVLSPSPDEAEPPTLRVGVRSRIGTAVID